MTNVVWLAEDARRRAKRRAQWRESKRRSRAQAGVIGHLHALSCAGPHKGHRYCRPIPVFAA